MTIPVKNPKGRRSDSKCERCQKVIRVEDKPYLFKQQIVCANCWKRLALGELASSELEDRSPDFFNSPASSSATAAVAKGKIVPSILKAILPLTVRGTLLWGFLGFLEAAIIGGITSLDRHPSPAEAAIHLERSVIFFALAGGICGVIYCLILAVHWHGGRKVPSQDLPMFFVGTVPTIAEVESRVPLLLASTVIGGALGVLCIAGPQDSLWAAVVIGAIIGLINGACLGATSTRSVSRHSGYLR